MTLKVYCFYIKVVVQLDIGLVMGSIISKVLQITVALVLSALLIGYVWFYASIFFDVSADPLFRLLFNQTIELGDVIDTGGHL